MDLDLIKTKYLHRRIKTLVGEVDEDHEGNERHTPPGTWGCIVEVLPQDACLSVVFDNEAWIFLTPEEAEGSDYELGEEEVPSSNGRVTKLREAAEVARRCRCLLLEAKAPKARSKAHSLVKSIEGAIRHEEGRPYRKRP